MKRMKLLILIFLFTLRAFCPMEQVLYLEQSEGVNPYDPVWRAICTIESNHNPKAIGDLNFKEYSYGIAQIRRSRLLDYYWQTGIWYNVTDMFSIEKSREVFMFYASQIDYRNTEKICREWNGGNRGMAKRSTQKYYLKVKTRL